MKAMLALEAIGYEYARQIRASGLTDHDRRRWAKVLARNHGKFPQPWVAELTGKDEFGRHVREFVKSTKDFSQANGTGSRGVRFFFLLETGKIYEVQELTSWTNKRRWFCRVTPDGAIQKLRRKDGC